MKKYIAIFILFFLTSLLYGCSKKVTVTIHFNNGEPNQVIDLDEIGYLPVVQTPEKDGYEFLGWYYQSDYQTAYRGERITKKTHLYAKYSTYVLGNESFVRFEQDGKWGLMIPQGKVIIEAIYDDISTFNYGRAMVIQDQTFNYIDENGTVLTSWRPYNPFLYDGIPHFLEDGLSILFDNDGSNIEFIDRFGVIQIQTNHIGKGDSYFSNGRAIVYKRHGELIPDTCTYIDLNGQLISDTFYKSCYPYNEGYAYIENDHGYQQLGLNGSISMETNYIEIYPLYDGVKPVYILNGLTIVKRLDENNHFVYSVVDLDGHVLFTSPTERIISFSEDRILTMDNGELISIYDWNGNLVSKTTYQPATYPAYGYYDGLMVVMNDQNLMGAIDQDGNVIIPFEYEDISRFKGGFSVVKKQGLYGVINTKNEIILGITYHHLKYYDDILIF